ncbi:hypothetical protein FOL47_009930 [Perkinsus chesapeaki]|uniref:Uncharacterized protein n=1 Tax=Perkinsus chesapeaki TaxID=330153 RepID=A0A7J6L5N9_PERCH|nr:hypothetical protein FOL47_009930 [Perkinsus chesapeaki]
MILNKNVFLGLLLAIRTAGMENGVHEASARAVHGKMNPIPPECLSGMMSPGFQNKNVTEETYYLVELYMVDFGDNGTTYENQLRVLPQNYTIHTIIVEPMQDYSHGAPKLKVTLVEDVEAVTNNHWAPPPERRLDSNDIPGSEKITFPMKVSDSLTLRRAYYRHIPSGVDIKGILIQFHGWGDTCESWEEYSKTTVIADELGLILITACGSEYGFYSNYVKYMHGWNAGVCCIQRQDIDDVEYVRMILEKENINNLPVYAYGYSNGGMMVESLLCHKVVDMAVSVNGVLALNPGLQGALKTCDNIYRVGEKPATPRVASVHCMDDEIVPYNGSAPEHSFWNLLRKYFISDLFPRSNKDIRRWAKRLGCERKASRRVKINSWTRLQEWVCPGEERVVSIQRSNCSYQGGRAHQVIRTFDFDPARWAAEFFTEGLR